MGWLRSSERFKSIYDIRIIPLILLALLLFACGGGESDTGTSSAVNMDIQQIASLAVTGKTSSSVTLSWAAPKISGGKARIVSYDLRFARSTITEDTWPAATQATGEPTPAAPGTAQGATVAGLDALATYYFDIRAVDDQGKVSVLSNLAVGDTLEPAYPKTVHLSACGELTQENTRYILDNDVRSEGTCFTVKAKNVTLDLSGHTILYDDYPNAGIANADFETGTDAAPADWDLTRAPTVVRKSTADYAMVNSWYLYFGNAANGSQVISPWTSLPPNSAAAAYFIRGDKIWAYQTPPLWNVRVEFEDGSTVLTKDFTKDQYFTFTTKPTAGRYRAVLTLVDGYGLILGEYGVYPSFDLFDLRPKNYNGIRFEFKDNLYVKNGRVVQGRGKSLFAHGLYVNGAKNVTISGISLENAGVEASSVYVEWGNWVRVDNCAVVNRNPYVFDRHQLTAALSVTNSNGVLIRDNRVETFSGWGGILAANTDVEIAGNTVTTRSAITNHHGIATAGTGADIPSVKTRIHHNTIEADPGQGIMSAPSGGEIYNNVINIRKTAPNFEYGYLTFDGITVKDYGNQTCKDLRVYNNAINLFGAYDKFFTGYASDKKVVNGIMNMCTGPNVVYDNNTIAARTVDPEVLVTGVEPGGMHDNPVTFSNNTIDSDMADIIFGGYAGQGDIVGNVLFVGNTIVRGTNPVNYHAFGMERNGNILSDKMRFINTKVVNAARIDDVQLPGSYGRFSYAVEWYAGVLVKDAKGLPLANASVVIKDKTLATSFAGTTDANGRIADIALKQYRHEGNGVTATSTKTYFTPHTISITPPGVSTVSQAVFMDSPKNIVYQVGSPILVTSAP